MPKNKKSGYGGTIACEGRRTNKKTWNSIPESKIKNEME